MCALPPKGTADAFTFPVAVSASWLRLECDRHAALCVFIHCLLPVKIVHVKRTFAAIPHAIVEFSVPDPVAPGGYSRAIFQVEQNRWRRLSGARPVGIGSRRRGVRVGGRRAPPRAEPRIAPPPRTESPARVPPWPSEAKSEAEAAAKAVEPQAPKSKKVVKIKIAVPEEETIVEVEITITKAESAFKPRLPIKRVSDPEARPAKPARKSRSGGSRRAEARTTRFEAATSEHRIAEAQMVEARSGKS
jgi:hypothetical protein